MISKMLEKQAESYMKNWNQSVVTPKKNFSIDTEITIVCKLDEESQNTISELIFKLQELDNRQQYYDKSDLHLTLYGGINPSTDMSSLLGPLKEIINKNKMCFELNRLGANHCGLSMLAFPIGFNLSAIRSLIRATLNLQEVPFKGSSYYEQIGWCSMLRFKEIPNNELTEYILQNKSNSFGIGCVKSIKAVKISNMIFENDSSTEEIFSMDI